MNKYLFKKSYIYIFILFLNCAYSIRQTNLTPAYLLIEPAINYYQGPEFYKFSYRTFTVFPYSLINSNSNIRGIMGKQILYSLRNCFEEWGYKFVELNESPDFIVTIEASSPYKETYVPPYSVTVPHWVPGQTISTFKNSIGSFNFDIYGDLNASGWGTWSGVSYETTYVPGYLTTKTYTSPGYKTGAFYPSVILTIFDGESFENVWLGTGTGASRNSDVRISSQIVLRHVLKNFPPCPQRHLYHPIGSSFVGISFSMYTNDGNNYFPTILRVALKSPAHKAGIKPYDMILSIDGVHMRNKTYGEVWKQLQGDVGTDVRISLWRLGKKIDLNLTRVKRENF